MSGHQAWVFQPASPAGVDSSYPLASGEQDQVLVQIQREVLDGLTVYSGSSWLFSERLGSIRPAPASSSLDTPSILGFFSRDGRFLSLYRAIIRPGQSVLCGISRPPPLKPRPVGRLVLRLKDKSISDRLLPPFGRRFWLAIAASRLLPSSLLPAFIGRDFITTTDSSATSHRIVWPWVSPCTSLSRS